MGFIIIFINNKQGLFRPNDTFTGDGSTTTFDLTNATPDGGDNDIQVFVDNVRQQVGVHLNLIGFDGSSEFSNYIYICSTSGQTIFVLNHWRKKR